jgi:hypothetical protein
LCVHVDKCAFDRVLHEDKTERDIFQVLRKAVTRPSVPRRIGRKRVGAVHL